MSFSTRILLGLALLSAAVPAAGQTVDHYDVAPSVLRANGQTIYPSGVSDPSLVNPPGPPPESAIPPPPAAGLPAGTTSAGPTVGMMPMGPPVGTMPTGSSARLVAQRSGQSGQFPAGNR